MRRPVLYAFALLLSLVIAFPALAASTAPTYSTALEVLNALIAAGAPINPDFLDDLTTATDSNELLGKKGSYSSKTNFGCTGYKQADPKDYTGGTVEFFETDAACLARYDYLQAIYSANAIFQDTSDYPRGNILVRIDQVIDKKKADQIVAAMDAIGLPASQVVSEKAPQSELETTSEPAAEPKGAPIAELAPTPVPVATPQPEYLELKKGDKGPNVARLQARLKDLGFLSGLADGDFGGKTVKAVTAFQAGNSLEQTGIASPTDQALLFSDKALDTKGKVREIIVYDETTCPVEISGIKLKSSYGFPYVKFKIKNIGQLPIKALTYEIECYDAYGDRVTGYDDSSFSDTYSNMLSPGKSVSLSTNSSMGLIGYEGTDTVHIAVVRILLEDGTDIQYDGDNVVWYEGGK